MIPHLHRLHSGDRPKSHVSGRIAKRRHTTRIAPRNSFARRALAGIMRRRLDVELKSFDKITPAFVIVLPGLVKGGLIRIGQGSTSNERTGRQILVKSIGFKYNIDLPGTDEVQNWQGFVRVMFVLDKQCNGALPLLEDVLQENGTLSRVEYRSFNNLHNRRRFVTLMDRTHTLKSFIQGNGVVHTSSGDIAYDSFYKTTDFTVNYSGSAGDTSEITSNNIFIIVLSSGGHSVFESWTRIRYQDV